MPEYPWYPHYPAEYMFDTRGLSLAEHGAYRMLMDYAYMHGGVVECDFDPNADANASVSHRSIHRILGCDTDEERWAVDAVLRRFWYRGDDGYRQNRIDRELAKRVEKSNKAKDSAEERWRREREKSPANADANASKRNAKAHANASETDMRNGCADDANHNHSNIHKKETLFLEAQNLVSDGGGSGGNPPPSAPANPAKKPKQEKPRHRLPENWRPTEAHFALAKELGVSIEHQAKLFRLNAEANGRTFASENAAFTMWLHKSLEYGRPGAGSGGPQPQPKKFCPVHPGVALDHSGACAACNLGGSRKAS